MKVRVVYKEDKTVAVIYPAPKSRQPEETEEEWLERVFARAIKQDKELEGQPFDDIDPSELPQDRTYRDLWRGEKGKGIRVATELIPEYKESLKTPQQKEIEALKARVAELEGLISGN